MATTTRLTATELLEWEGNEPHVQLIDGEVVVNSPRMSQQTLVGAPRAELPAWTSTRLPGFAIDLTSLSDEP